MEMWTYPLPVEIQYHNDITEDRHGRPGCKNQVDSTFKDIVMCLYHEIY